MKGTYITTAGKCVKVLNFDAEHKMAYTDFGEGDIHWVGEPEYKDWVAPTYVPDIPAQIIEQNKIQENAIRIETTNEVDVCEQTTDGEEVGGGNSEPEVIAEESNEIKSKEEIVKPKRTYKKKADAANKE